MLNTVFFEFDFYLLIACSIVLPAGIYGFLLRTKSISRYTTLIFSVLLITLSGVDVMLLKTLATSAKATTSMQDDMIFSSELSMSLYLLPAVFAGIGVNLLSHVLIGHLSQAEQKFDQEHCHS